MEWEEALAVTEMQWSTEICFVYRYLQKRKGGLKSCDFVVFVACANCRLHLLQPEWPIVSTVRCMMLVL